MPTIRPGARCDTALGHDHDMIGLALGRWAQARGRKRACGRERARGRGAMRAGARGTARAAQRVRASGTRPEVAIRPGSPATIRPLCAHLGVPGCPAWQVGCLCT